MSLVSFILNSSDKKVSDFEVFKIYNVYMDFYQPSIPKLKIEIL